MLPSKCQILESVLQATRTLDAHSSTIQFVTVLYTTFIHGQIFTIVSYLQAPLSCRLPQRLTEYGRLARDLPLGFEKADGYRPVETPRTLLCSLVQVVGALDDSVRFARCCRPILSIDIFMPRWLLIVALHASTLVPCSTDSCELLICCVDISWQ